MKNLIWIILSMAFVSACNVSSENSSQSYSYRFKINNQCQGVCGPEDNERCEIDKSFTSKTDYCEGLRNAELNEGCARSGRKAKYEAECGGAFEDTHLGGFTTENGDGCKSNSQFTRKDLTRSELCSLIAQDEAAQPCTAQHGFYSELKRRYDCR